MELDKGIDVHYGPLKARIFGGKFRSFSKERRLIGVKMAAEITHPHDISIPTEDFDVPDKSDMAMGMLKAIDAIRDGNDIYAGCMVGIGRTGLFMALMARLMFEYEAREWDPEMPLQDPVEFVRTHYNSHAVETKNQRLYVEEFDLEPLFKHLDAITKPKVEVRVEVVKEPFYPGFMDYMRHWLGFTR